MSRITRWGIAHLPLVQGLFALSLLATGLTATIAAASDAMPSPEQITALSKWPLVLILAVLSVIMGVILYKIAMAMAKMSREHSEAMGRMIDQARSEREKMAHEYRESIREIGNALQQMIAAMATKPCLMGDVAAMVERIIHERMAGQATKGPA